MSSAGWRRSRPRSSRASSSSSSVRWRFRMTPTRTRAAARHHFPSAPPCRRCVRGPPPPPRPIGACREESRMTETTGGRRSGGRAARQAARAISNAVSVPYITRALKPFEVLTEEHLSLIEGNADTRARAGRDRVPRHAGGAAAVQERGCRHRRRAGALPPRARAQHRAGDRSGHVHPGRAQPCAHREIGGPNTVRSPLRTARRSSTTSTTGAATARSPTSATSSSSPISRRPCTTPSVVCEPVDVPVNKRHLHIIYALMRYSDKPFMGSVTPRRGPGHRRDGQARVRRRLPRLQHGDRLARQLQLADGLGLDHARCAQGVCGRQPGRRHHAVRARGCDHAGLPAVGTRAALAEALAGIASASSCRLGPP